MIKFDTYFVTITLHKWFLNCILKGGDFEINSQLIERLIFFDIK